MDSQLVAALIGVSVGLILIVVIIAAKEVRWWIRDSRLERQRMARIREEWPLPGEPGYPRRRQ